MRPSCTMSSRMRMGNENPYSWRKHSMGLSAAARCAGYIPAPTVISPNVNNDAMIASGEITGCGTISGKSTLPTT